MGMDRLISRHSLLARLVYVKSINNAMFSHASHAYACQLTSAGDGPFPMSMGHLW